MSMLPGIGIMPGETSGSGGGSGIGGSECSGQVLSSFSDGSYHVVVTLPVVRNPAILEIRAVGRRTNGLGHAGYVRRAVVCRGIDGDAVVMSTSDSTLTREYTAAWDARIVASGSSVQVQVRGATDASVNWRVSWVFNSISGYGLLTTDGVYHTIQTIPLMDDTAYMIEALTVGIRTDAAGYAGYVHRALVYREGGGIAVMQSVPDSNLTRESAAEWDSTLVVSGNNLLLQVCGSAGQTISWKSDYSLEELGA